MQAMQRTNQTTTAETNVLKVTASQAKQIIKRTYKMLFKALQEGRRVKATSIYLHGESGTAKSSIIDQCGVELSLELGLPLEMFYMDLSSKESLDVRGLPNINKDGRTAYSIPLDLPMSGYGFLVMDEITRTQEQTRAPAQDLFTAKRVGEYRLPPGFMVICAGNDIDKGVTPTSVAFNTRVMHLYIVPSLDDWLTWAADNGIHPLVTGFLRLHESSFHKWDAKNHCQPNQRTWEMVSDWVWELDLESDDDLDMAMPIWQGYVGYGVAMEFGGFIRMSGKCPDPMAVIMSPLTEEVPTEPSILYALTSALARRAQRANFTPIYTYLERCPVEFKVACIKLIIDRENNERRDETVKFRAELGLQPGVKATADQLAKIEEHSNQWNKKYSIKQTAEFSKFTAKHQHLLF